MSFDRLNPIKRLKLISKVGWIIIGSTVGGIVAIIFFHYLHVFESWQTISDLIIPIIGAGIVAGITYHSQSKEENVRQEILTKIQQISEREEERYIASVKGPLIEKSILIRKVLEDIDVSTAVTSDVKILETIKGQQFKEKIEKIKKYKIGGTKIDNDIISAINHVNSLCDPKKVNNNLELLKETLKKCTDIFKTVLNDIDSYIFQHNLEPEDIPKFTDFLQVIKQQTSIYIVVGSKNIGNRWDPQKKTKSMQTI